MNEVTTILWDWNGTLLNDTGICVESINELLQERNLPRLSRKRYLQVFGFPVKQYYQTIGFDFEKEPFEIPARRYIEVYHSKLQQCGLQPGSLSILQFFRERGMTQLLLSASEHTNLETAIAHFGLESYFREISGLDNIYAHSKSEIGKALLKKQGIDPAKTCLIGDTLHDREVAGEIGCKCLLVGSGHQSFERLQKNGVPLLKNLEEIPALFE